MSVLLIPEDGDPRLIEEMFDVDLDEVSIVDRPATARNLTLFKALAKGAPEGVDTATYERCIQEVMASGQSKESAFAICTAGGAGEGKTMPTITVKQDEMVPGGMPGDVPVPEAPELDTAAVVEIPATPKTWPFAKCIEAGMGMGLAQDESIAVCQLINQKYGDPSDPDTILVPDGLKPEGLFATVAVDGGMAKPEGMAAAEDSGDEKAAKFMAALASVPKGYKFTPSKKDGPRGGHWLGTFKRFLGLDRPPSEAEVERQKMERQVSELSQAQMKTTADLRAIVGTQQRMIEAFLQTQGFPIQPVPAAALEGAIAGDPPVATPTMPTAPEPAPVGDPVKSVPATAPAPAGQKATLEDLAARLEALEVENAELRGLLESPEAVALEAAAALAPAVSAAPAPKFAPRRAGVDPTIPGQKRMGPAESEMVYSTICGAPIPRADRDAFLPSSSRGR
jgi:hypothetical protein